MKVKLLDKSEVASLLPPVSGDAHKGTQGHALVIGGSYGMGGSICLTSLASLRAGCGLTTAFVPGCVYPIIQTYVPEVMALTDRKKKYISDIAYDLNVQAIAIGPGLGSHKATHTALMRFLKHNQSQLIIDADAINIMAANDACHLLKPGDILTPHPKELERLIGTWKSHEEMLSLAVGFSLRHQVILVAKGAPTLIIDGQNIYENTTGNPGLATAGSGDVLTGILAGLKAQGLPSLDTAICAVYLHGLSADIGIVETGVRSFIASDIPRFLGRAFLELDSSAKT